MMMIIIMMIMIMLIASQAFPWSRTRSAGWSA